MRITFYDFVDDILSYDVAISRVDEPISFLLLYSEPFVYSLPGSLSNFVYLEMFLTDIFNINVTALHAQGACVVLGKLEQTCLLFAMNYAFLTVFELI